MPRIKIINQMKTIFLLIAAIFTAGCSINRDLKETAAVQQYATPSSLPVSAVTDFTQSIQCMDDRLTRYIQGKIKIVIMEEEDTTGQVVGAKDMLITALSKMARKSQSISISAVNLGDGDRYIRELAENVLVSADVNVDSPKYYIRVSQPQIDESVASDRMQAGLRFIEMLDGTVSRDTLMTAMSLDMNMGRTTTLENIPGVYSSNTVAIKRSGNALGSSGTMEKLGVLFRVTTDRAEGFHHTMRQLVELGSIELIGRLTHIPYWECLDIAASNKAVQRQIEDWYNNLSPEALLKFVQSKLQTAGYYGGDVDGVDTVAIRNSIAAYKGHIGLLATSDIDIALYRHLLTDQTAVAAEHIPILAHNKLGSDAENNMLATAHTSAGFNRTVPLELETQLDNLPSLNEGEKISFTATPTTDAHLYCYYQKPGLLVHKIFPNRFRRDSFVKGGKDVRIPGGADRFTLDADARGDRHDILCIASQIDLEKDSFLNLDKMMDLFPIFSINDIPINNLAQIYEVYKQAAFAKQQALPVSSYLSTRVFE
jgi:hypothetical protein